MFMFCMGFVMPVWANDNGSMTGSVSVTIVPYITCTLNGGCEGGDDVGEPVEIVSDEGIEYVY